jgi:hypothetical protein
MSHPTIRHGLILYRIVVTYGFGIRNAGALRSRRCQKVQSALRRNENMGNSGRQSNRARITLVPVPQLT